VGSEIIILGSGATGAECPFDKEVWGCNNTIRNPNRLDKLFFFDNILTFNPEIMHIDDLITRGNKVEYITTFHNAKFCSRKGILATVYPLAEVVKKFNTTYFANTVCYMIAYAMYMGAEKMDLYGIDHLTWQSYIVERCGVEYWLGRAEQSGVEVNITQESALCKTMDGKMYGYDEFYNGGKTTYAEVVQP